MASKKRKAGKLVSLSPDRRLLDSSFDGYKLSLEAFPKYSTCLESEIDRVVLNQNQYSYQHLKAFATFNHLITDPFNSNVIFTIDKLWKVYKINVQLCSGALQKPYSVFEIPESRTRRQMDGRYHVTLSVFSQDWLVLADGTGFLYIIKTGPRDNDMDLWRIHYSGSPLGEQESSKVEHSHTFEENGRTLLSILLLSVKGEEEFRTVYNWLTFELDERENWDLIRTRRLEGQSFPDYCCTAGNFLYVSAERPPQFVYDSLQPIVDDNDAADGAETTDKAIPPYYWYQKAEEVVVTVCAPEDITKSDVECKIGKKDILLRINTSTILEGSLYESVSPDESTWTLVDNKLEVTLSKCVNNCWNEVVIGDDRGERIFSAEQAAEIHERLAHLTSNLQNPDPDKGENKPFNSQQLEECDFFPEETSALLRIDGDSHNITHQANLSSHQHLFSVPPVRNELPSLCIRHDVDGLIWRIDSTLDIPWYHDCTFNALGYVSASKRNKKYFSCSPNCQYTVLCDCVRHIYIYRQPIPSTVRNRKASNCSNVAKQHVISLEETENIEGMVVLDKAIVLLVENKIYVVNIEEE